MKSIHAQGPLDRGEKENQEREQKEVLHKCSWLNINIMRLSATLSFPEFSVQALDGTRRSVYLNIL